MDFFKLREFLLRAVSDNDIGKVKEVLCKCNLATSDAYQKIVNDSLIEAVKLGRLDHINLLLENGADVQHEDEFNQSVLIRSFINATHKDPNVIKLLLSKGANINHRGRNGQSDLIYLMENGILSNSDTIALIDSVGDIQERLLRTGGSYLHIVSQRPFDDDKLALLETLIDKGVSVNARDNYDDTPLHLAAKVACYNALGFLIERGADIKARNRNGETALHSLSYAIEESHFSDALQLLLSKGLDINETDFQGRTVFHQTLLMENLCRNTVEILLRNGLKVNVKDCRGRNEMFYALTDIDFKILDVDVRTDVMKALANYSVDINDRDIHGLTPLHLAVQLNDLDLLVTLIDLGADFTLKSNTGATPMHFACKQYNMTHVMIWTYLENNKNIDVTDNFGSTPLHWAVWYRNVSAVQSLLQVGADATISDSCGDTPSDLAKKLDFGEFQNLLESYRTLESLELIESTIEHTNKDYVAACPLLRYIERKGDGLDLEQYTEHLHLHEANVRKFIDKILRTQTMGLYYDIAENESIPKTFGSFMTTVAAKVASRNPLFKCELRLAGSTYEGTKVQLPDEFDYLWILTEFNDAFTPVESEEFPDGFIQLRLKSELDKARFAECIDSNNCLDADLVVRTFYKVVNEVVQDTLAHDKMFENFVCIDYLNEIWCSISNLIIKYFGTQVKELLISIDVVPSIELSNWTPNAFPVEKIASLNRLNDTRFSVVLKTPDRLHVKHFKRLFRVSYAYMEQHIFRHLPNHVKKGYIVLKALREAGYIPKVIDRENQHEHSYITSYFFKTCALNLFESLEYEAHDNDKSDAGDFGNAYHFAKEIVNYLDKCVSEKQLPTHFDTKKNLIGLLGVPNSVVEPEIFTGLLELLKCLLGMFETNKAT